MNFIFFINSLLLSALIPFILGGFILSRYLKIKKLNWDFQFLINTSKEFLPFAIMTILFSTNERINQVLIEKIAGETESGLFAGAYRWNNAIAMYLWTILPIFFAKFSHNKLDPPLNQSLFHLGWVIVAIPILFVAFWVQFYGEILFIQFSNSNSAEIQKMFLLLKILIATVALNACFNIFSTWLTASGFVHQTNKILFIAMSSNFFLSFILIPLYKSVGGSVALLAAFIIQSLGFFYYFLKHKNFNLEPKIFIKSVFVLISGIFLLFLGYKINLHWFLNTVVCIVWITVFLFAMKLIQWKKTD
jgi:O-antigen/teichoic acid export membrane protein